MPRARSRAWGLRRLQSIAALVPIVGAAPNSLSNDAPDVRTFCLLTAIAGSGFFRFGSSAAIRSWPQNLWRVLLTTGGHRLAKRIAKSLISRGESRYF
jgi:hypothetical protein